MVKMYKGDRVVNAAEAQVKRLKLAGWSSTPPGDAPEPVDPQPVDDSPAEASETEASEPETATEDAAEPEAEATNGGDEGEPGEAPGDDADPDQDELPLAADSEQPGA